MQRYYWVVIAGLGVVIAALFLWLNLRPGTDAPGAPPMVSAGPLVPEFTPDGWRRYQQAYTDPHRPVLETYLRDAFNAGRSLDGYLAVGPEHRKPAFAYLAEHLADHALFFPKSAAGHLRDLATLIEWHAADYPDDPRVTYFRACHLAARGRHAEAEPLYAKGVPALPEPEREQSKRHWACSLADLGRWEPAYDLIGHRPGGFDRVATVLLDRGHLAPLAAMIDRHRRADPNEPQIAYFQGHLRWRDRDYPAAVERFTAYLAGPRSKWAHDLGRKIVTAADLRFRGLFRLGRLVEARAAAAKPPTVTAPTRTWDAILAAAGGDTPAVIHLLAPDARLQTAGYADDDLGPLLRSPTMAPVRAKYPPPVDPGPPAGDNPHAGPPHSGGRQ